MRYSGRGSKANAWKNGRRPTSSGYIRIYKPEHPFCDKQGYVMEHRLVMEEYIGRHLDPKEAVHHKNKIHYDNRIENLQLFDSNGLHTSYELKGRIFSEEHKQKISLWHSNNFIDMSDRICSICNKNKTTTNKFGRPVWRYLNNKLVCHNCYTNTTRYHKK